MGRRGLAVLIIAHGAKGRRFESRSPLFFQFQFQIRFGRARQLVDGTLCLRWKR